MSSTVRANLIRPDRFEHEYAAAVQHWEYRVVSLTDGQYTSSLNDYGRDGWELVTVVPDVQAVPEKREGGLPMPGIGGTIGAAASKLKDLEGSNEPAPGTITTTLLWVLRRLVDDYDELEPS
jgi:hypothetical protein